MADDEALSPIADLELAPEGLVACDACGVIVSPRGNHYSVHYPNHVTTRVCPRSWPPANQKAKP